MFVAYVCLTSLPLPLHFTNTARLGRGHLLTDKIDLGHVAIESHNSCPWCGKPVSDEEILLGWSLAATSTSYVCAHWHVFPHAYALREARAHVHTHKRAHANTRTHAHAHAHMRTHAHARTHTHTLNFFPNRTHCPHCTKAFVPELSFRPLESAAGGVASAAAGVCVCVCGRVCVCVSADMHVYVRACVCITEHAQYPYWTRSARTDTLLSNHREGECWDVPLPVTAHPVPRGGHCLVPGRPRPHCHSLQVMVVHVLVYPCYLLSLDTTMAGVESRLALD